MTIAKRQPLDVRYSFALAAPTPAQSQVAEMAAAAHVALSTARAWLSGKQIPSEQSFILLEQHYEMSREALFSPGHFDNAKND